MEADAGHLHLSKGDKERAIVLALEKFPGKTQAEIARQVECCQQYVQRIKSEFTTSSKLEVPTTVTGKDGKSYPTSKPRKPSPVPAEEPPLVSPCGSIHLSQIFIALPAAGSIVRAMNATPTDKPRLSQQARDMAKAHGLSIRTAYRHLARGTEPATNRRIGGDGKTYPATTSRRIDRTKIGRELDLARQALRRAEKLAGAEGFFPDDLVKLKEVKTIVASMAISWRSA